MHTIDDSRRYAGGARGAIAAGLIAACLSAVALATGAPDAVAAAKRCGTITVPFNGMKMSALRVDGTRSCAFVRKVLRSGVGTTCQGTRIRAGFVCSPGNRRLGMPSSDGFTATRGGEVYVARIRR